MKNAIIARATVKVSNNEWGSKSSLPAMDQRTVLKMTLEYYAL